MLRARLVGAARRVKRVGEQEQGLDQAGFGGGEHRGLASSIGMAAEEDAGEIEIAEGLNRGAEAGLILLGAVVGWPVRAELAEGQIAAKHGNAGLAEGIGEGDQEGRLAVGSCSVGQDNASIRRSGGAMEEARDGRFGVGVAEFGDVRVHGPSPWYVAGTAAVCCA